MDETPDPMKTALDALGKALQRAAAAASANPQFAPIAEKAASALGSTVEALATDAGAGRTALSSALESVSGFVADASSGDPERRAAATAKLAEIQQRLAGPDSPAQEVASRAASWAQEVARGAEASPASERLSGLWTTIRSSYERVQAKAAAEEAPLDGAPAEPPDAATDDPG